MQYKSFLMFSVGKKYISQLLTSTKGTVWNKHNPAFFTLEESHVAEYTDNFYSV